MADRATRLSREAAAAFPTFRISFGLFLFFFNLKISSSAIPQGWHYRISYFSTRKVVSVENLTGLFPSTWVTLVTCGDKTPLAQRRTPLPTAATRRFLTLGRSQGRNQPSAFTPPVSPERKIFVLRKPEKRGMIFCGSRVSAESGLRGVTQLPPATVQRGQTDRQAYAEKCLGLEGRQIL